MSRRPWLDDRREVFKWAQEEFSGRKMRWIGGILFFSKNLKAVPGARHVPKTGRQAVGLQVMKRHTV